jgi:hypothetical protein
LQIEKSLGSNKPQRADSSATRPDRITGTKLFVDPAPRDKESLIGVRAMSVDALAEQQDFVDLELALKTQAYYVG